MNQVRIDGIYPFHPAGVPTREGHYWVWRKPTPETPGEWLVGKLNVYGHYPPTLWLIGWEADVPPQNFTGWVPIEPPADTPAVVEDKP